MGGYPSTGERMTFNLKNNGKSPRLGKYLIPESVKNKIAVNLGSNHCQFEIAHASKFEKIFFFEACYNNFLKGVARVYGRGLKNCFGFNLAASNKTGELLKIYSHSSGDCGSNTTIAHDGVNKEDYHYVMSISLEDILKLIGVERINYLKIDIEGGEFSVLMEADLSKIDCVAIEIHSLLGEEKMTMIRNKLLETHEMKYQKPAIPNICNEESYFELRKQEKNV